ncbi:prephenate dehydratase [Anaerosolibacter carboniphilus]|uniref:Prephenate dehydratase n=1 Tax=Anaerosolibacter carboniphilus TaxID=1417629 RepID=A0A841KWB2_9FIRM|nr:prephenate dehydratase [Anaerosolibacter carboniphilus]MBB6217663.1 prephenate dehydratase [Anaerosolibacter carboniphilus]
MKLGYLGPKGSYSYEAALSYQTHALHLGFKTFYEIIQSVEDGMIDIGILPIENSTEGAVNSVMDGLLRTSRAKITGELVLPIVHNLLGTDKSIEEIRYVYSHPQAIEQCREYFRINHPNMMLLSCESSATACVLAKEKGSGYGAISSKTAAEIYELDILGEAIQDNSFNQTRFVAISQEDEVITNQICKTSIAFSFHNDSPGSLYAVLKEFAVESINLTRIESRPAKAELGKYIFYIDLCGHQDDPEIRKVLSNIQRITNFFKIFGSYPVFTKQARF